MAQTEIGIRLRMDGAQQVNQAVGTVQQGLDGLGAVSARLGPLLGGLVGAAAGAQFIALADSVTVLNNQLKLATGSTEAAKAAYGSLFEIAQRSRVSFTELGGTYASIARATQELGISQGRLLTITEAIGNSMAISGGSAQSMQAALVQLSQGFASGTLRGEELNSVMEQTPRLAQAIAAGLGVSVGQLRELGKEGRLTAQAVLQALESQASTLAREVGDSVVTVGQAMTQLTNGFTAAVGEIDRVTGSSRAAAAVLQATAVTIGDIASAFREMETAGDGASDMADGIAVVFETLAVLGANLAYIVRMTGKEIQGLGAQAVALASGDLATFRFIRQSMVEESEQARVDIDKLTERILNARRLRKEAEAEAARSTKAALYGGAGYGDRYTGTIALGAKKDADALRDLQREQEKQRALLADLNGLTTDYYETLARLQAMRQAGVLTEVQYVAAVERHIAKQPGSIALAKAQAEAHRAVIDAMTDEMRARAQLLQGLDEQAASQQRELQQTEDEVYALQYGRAALEERITLRKEEQLANIELEATRALLERSDAAEYQRLREMAVALQGVIDRRRELAGLLVAKEQREEQQRAAQDAAADWQRTADDIRRGLTDAFRESFRAGEDFGEAFARNIAAELKARLATAAAEALSGLVLQAAGISLGQGSGGAGSLASYAQLLQTGESLYGRGMQAYNWLTGAGSLSVTSGSAATLGGTVAQGSATKAALYSNLGYTGEATAASSAGASSSAGWATTAGWVAAAVLGAMRANQAYSDGFRRDQAHDVYDRVNTGVYGDTVMGKGFNYLFLGGVQSDLANGLSKLGFSDRLADLLSGATAVSALLGFSEARLTSKGITGSIGGGDFTGEAFAEYTQKAGFINKLWDDDKVTPVKSALPVQVGNMLDSASASLLDAAKDYGKALGLPVAQLAGITSQIKVTFTDDAKKNQAALLEALAGYGDALVAGYADALAPLANYGESTAQTLERVGAAMAGVNDVLDTLGLTALQASIDGGKAAVSLQDLFGGLGNLQQAAGGYLQAYYSDAERTALATKAIAGALADFGLQLPASRDGFRDLVEAQDLTTVAGREAFAALMGVAGAFAEITPAAEAAAAGLASALDSVIADFLDGPALAQYRAGRIVETLRGGGIEATTAGVMAATRDDIVALWNSVGTAGKQAILDAYGAWEAMADGMASDINRLARLADGVGSVIGDFLTGNDLTQYQAAGVVETLRGGGIEATPEGVINATRADIVALWNSVGIAGKEAILTAYGAWVQMQDGITAGLQGQIDAITAEYGDLSVIAEPVKTLSQSYAENRDRLAELETGLNTLLGNVSQTVQETLADMLAGQQALRAYRTSLADTIEEARLRGLSPTAKVEALRTQEAALFAQLPTAADPVAVAQKLSGVILARIGAEAELQQDALETQARLRQAARETEMDALREQIGAAERLSDLAKDIAQFTSTARFGNLSPLSAQDQLAAARGLFDTTLGAAATDVNAQQNLLTNAQAYLSELASFAPVGTEQYASEFARVTGALDELGLSAAGGSQELQTLRDQLAALESVDENVGIQTAVTESTSAAQVAAFTTLSDTLATRDTAMQTAIDKQIKLAEDEIAETRAMVKNQYAQLEQQAAIVKRLETAILARNTDDRLAGSQPTVGVGGSSWAGG